MNRISAILAVLWRGALFAGLVFTVCGLYCALDTIAIASHASIHEVADAVREALIMTALGIAVAMPAVLAVKNVRGR